MATHSSVLAWRIPGTREPVRLPSIESHRVRRDWSNLAAAAAANDLVGFPTFFNFSLNFAIRSWWSEPQSTPCLVCWLYRASPSLTAKNVINLISVLTIWWFARPHDDQAVISKWFHHSCCLLCPVHSLGKVLLVSALLHFVLQGQIFPLLQVSLDSLLSHSIPLRKRTFCVCVH